MIDKVISKKTPDAIILRFDPWLISGSSDLISQFMAELSFAINEKAKTLQGLGNAGKLIARYGAMLSPGLNMALPGLGNAVQGGFKAAEKALGGEASLSSMRAKLSSSLADVKVPIVVLIDELDRVEDGEILAVAQLVRAIVDFPRVSFALAYDVDRVMEALGRSSKDRGAAYLEKIVQLQVPIPIMLPAERAVLLRADLEQMELKDQSGHALNFDSQAYISMVSLLNGPIINTPRDIKRVTGAFQALFNMIGEEVAWVELLGYCALLSKYPAVIEIIRNEPERLVLNPLDPKERARRLKATDQANADWLDQMVGSGASTAARPLVQRLFPVLNVSKATSPMANALAFRRPFLTVLRLGLVPGTLTRQDALGIINEPRPDVKQGLNRHLVDGNVSALVDRIDGVVLEVEPHSTLQFWLGARDFLAKEDTNPLTRSPIESDLLDEFVNIMGRSSRRNNSYRRFFEELAEKLVNEQDIVMVPAMVRRHFWVHGLYGHQPDKNRDWYLGLSATSRISEAVKDYLSELLESGHLLNRINSLEPLYILRSMRRSDTIFKSRITEFIETKNGVDTMSLLWFGRGWSPGKFEIEQYCDPKIYINAVKERLRDLEGVTSPLVRALAAADSAL